MATCKDCLHWEACSMIFREAIGRETTVNGNRAEQSCLVFKDRTKYVEQKQGEWVINSESEDGFEHHMCSCCKENAHYSYTFINDYDEGLDGEWEYLGQIENGIIECLDDYCSNCGAVMKKSKEI